MKKVIGLFVLLLVGFSTIGNAQEFETQGEPDISFEKTSHDFGKILQGDPVSYEFKLTNTGDAPLVLTNVEPSCGCTTPKWPKKPIKPGDTATIKAVYDAKSMGAFNKSIMVHTNVPFSGTQTLKISGTVVKKEDAEG